MYLVKMTTCCRTNHIFWCVTVVTVNFQLVPQELYFEIRARN